MDLTDRYRIHSFQNNFFKKRLFRWVFVILSNIYDGAFNQTLFSRKISTVDVWLGPQYVFAFDDVKLEKVNFFWMKKINTLTENRGFFHIHSI